MTRDTNSIRDVAADAHYVSNNCVVYTYYNDVAHVIEDHFSRSLGSRSPSSYSHKNKDTCLPPFTQRNLPPSFFKANFQPVVTPSHHHLHHTSPQSPGGHSLMSQPSSASSSSSSHLVHSPSHHDISPSTSSSSSSLIHSSSSPFFMGPPPPPSGSLGTHSSSPSTSNTSSSSSSDPYSPDYGHGHHHGHHPHHPTSRYPIHSQHPDPWHPYGVSSLAAAAASTPSPYHAHHHHHHHHRSGPSHDPLASAYSSTNRFNAGYSSLLLQPAAAAATMRTSRLNPTCGAFDKTTSDMTSWLGSAARYHEAMNFATGHHAMDSSYSATAAYGAAMSAAMSGMESH